MGRQDIHQMRGAMGGEAPLAAAAADLDDTAAIVEPAPASLAGTRVVVTAGPTY